MHKLVSRVHRYVALLLAVQLLFWTVGGVVMSWIPIETVRGEHLVSKGSPAAIQRVPQGLLIEGVVALEGRTLGDKTYLKRRFDNGHTDLVDPNSGLVIPVTEDMVRQAVQDGLKSEGTITKIEKLTGKAPIDYRRAMPVWRAFVSDSDGLRVYVSDDTAQILSVRSDTWRFYDFFWMLHIMDYENRSNFNNPLIMIFSLTASIFCLSGFGLLFFRFKPGVRRFFKAKGLAL